VWFRAGDDLEHEICRQRWSLRRHAGFVVGVSSVVPWPFSMSPCMSSEVPWMVCERVGRSY
jgi:hypothetical protein